MSQLLGEGATALGPRGSTTVDSMSLELFLTQPSKGQSYILGKVVSLYVW